jgi:ATP-dependent RNA helicase DHX29
MAKKKKTQLKPVARGFATTSQPKRLTPEPEPDVEPVRTRNDKPHDGTTESESVVDHGPIEDETDDTDSELQSFVDKWQEKIEKEITRCDPVNVSSAMHSN